VYHFDLVRLEQAFEATRRAVQEGIAPCAVLAVISGQELIRVETFSAPNGPQIQPNARFLLASITKPIFALAVMHLVERGLLSLAAPVSAYLPEFQGHSKANLTAWHLLTHTSGLPEIDWATTLNAYPNHAVSFQVACTAPLSFAPGERIAYSTLSFFVLGELISRLSGQSYRVYLEEHVLKPLGMFDTGFDPRDKAIDMVPVQGITADSNRNARDATDFFISLAMPGAGLWSTSSDLVRFMQAHLRHENILTPHTQAWMTRDHTMALSTLEGDARHYGLAWRKSPLSGRWPGSPQVYEHDGATGSLLWVDPEYDIGVLYLTSSFGADPRVSQHALNAVYGALKAS
jgi:serine-type D-Ala-D-Ala carboxypeptidase